MAETRANNHYYKCHNVEGGRFKHTSDGHEHKSASTSNRLKYANQGPVVQSIVSLTSSLRGQLVKCFTTF